MYFPTTFLTNLFLGSVSTMALGRGVVPLPRLILKFLLFFYKAHGHVAFLHSSPNQASPLWVAELCVLTVCLSRDRATMPGSWEWMQPKCHRLLLSLLMFSSFS